MNYQINLDPIKKTWETHLEDLEVELQDGTHPVDWIRLGFSYSDYQAWFAAGGFDPERVRELEDMGIEPSEVSHRVSINEELEFNLPYSRHSIAYLWCNNDISIEQLRALKK